MHPTTKFNVDDMELANEIWGANCGPGAIAAMCHMTLEEVRPFMGDFEQKHYTNPTLMWDVLHRLGVGFTRRVGNLGQDNFPSYGLARIQWTGPWTRPGVPARAAYRHTHWVGAMIDPVQGVGIFDVNMIANGTGWASLANWQNILVPWLLSECERHADGGWFITHCVEITRLAASV